MRHPFDGINVSHSCSTPTATPNRRSALGRMLCAAAGVVGLNSVAIAQVTKAKGEAGAAPITQALKEQGGVATTLAIGEEGAATAAVNEQGGIVAARPAPLSTDLTDKQMDEFWQKLGDADSTKGMVASNALFAAKKVVPFLKEKLKPEAGIDAKGLEPMLKGLDAENFADREAASGAIVKLGVTALPAIRAAIAKGGSPEVVRRLQMVEMNIKGSPEFLRGQRGVQILNDHPAKEARVLAEGYTKQAPETWLNAEAKAILARGVSIPAPPPIPVPKTPKPLEDK